MEENKIFKNLWRFNAIIISVAGVLGVVVSLLAANLVITETRGSKHRNEVVNVDPETEIEESFRLGRIQHINGSNSVIVPLYSDQGFSLKYSGKKSTASTRNILFSNMHDETSFWLLPTNEYLVAQHRLVNESNSYDRDKDIVTILYQVVKADTNADDRLTSNDKLTLALSTPEGEGYSEVLFDVDQILGYDVLNKKTLAVMFNRNQQGYTVYINLTDFSVTKEIALPKV